MHTVAQSHNRPRFFDAGATSHVESYFWRANDPQRPRAFWLKATVLRRQNGHSLADVWCCLFDEQEKQAWGGRQTVALTEAHFEGTPLAIHLGDSHFVLDPNTGRTSGRLSNELGHCEWDLQFSTVEGPLGTPLSIFPFRWMIDSGFPRSKTLTPHPCLSFEGTMNWSGRETPIRNWIGMQGHNWGKEHTPRYAWGQCIFMDQGNPCCMVEGFSGRIQIAGRLTPPISALVVRHQGEEIRFDGLLNLWNQSAILAYPAWVLHMKGSYGEVELEMTAQPELMACLGYENPNGALSYCLNSKLAYARLRLSPKHGKSVEYTSLFGGALEFLVPENPGFRHVV